MEWALTNSETEFAREAIEKRKSEIAEKGPEENGVKWAIEKNQLEVLSFLLNNAASLGGDEALKIAKECEERNGKECRVLVEDKTHLGDVVDVLDRALERNYANTIERIAKKQGFTFQSKRLIPFHQIILNGSAPLFKNPVLWFPTFLSSPPSNYVIGSAEEFKDTWIQIFTVLHPIQKQKLNEERNHLQCEAKNLARPNLVPCFL